MILIIVIAIATTIILKA